MIQITQIPSNVITKQVVHLKQQVSMCSMLRLHTSRHTRALDQSQAAVRPLLRYIARVRTFSNHNVLRVYTRLLLNGLQIKYNRIV